ncbi:MAG: xanthine dehydrogenase family protein subunit M [Rhodospirillaceae bacterium]|nr:xanthine dehydrogenase family protein subunit M [Rhodospirillaceae bacterium]
MYAFDYKKVASLEDAQKVFESADDGTFMAGGMTLIPTLKQRLASPTDVIDLDGIDELRGINVDSHSVTIGAMTCHADVAASSDVKKAIPALAHLASLIGDPQVRNRGTIGGSIANNDPAADYPGALVGLGATVHTTKKTVSADDFFTGMFETALEENELVTKVSFPIPEKAAYQKFPNPASRYAVVGAFVAKTSDGIRVAITGAGPTVFRVPEMEKELTGSFTVDAISDIAVPTHELNSDLHATAEYRAHLIGVMAKRAVADCG